MDPPSTYEEWKTLISSVKDSLPSIQHALYPAPKDAASIARTIDHTQLSLSATQDQIDVLCSEAREHNFATVCVRLNYVSRAVTNLSGTDVGVACVVGFHEGTQSTAEKVAEAREAVQAGASELDMVMNYPLLKAGRFSETYADIRAVREAAGDEVGLKVIIETSQLSRDEIIAASTASCLAGADHVKTSTGFNGPGASVENVALMRAVAEGVKRGVKVKASGGVRTADDCIKMIQAGADRIGASAGVKIVQGMGEGGSSQETSGAGGY
jgi:deoxyribose-phosphate aldolase